MSTEFYDQALSQIRDIIAHLQSSVRDKKTLLALLSAPLASLGLLPPNLRQYNTSPLPGSFTLDVSRHIPPLQRAIIEHVAPTWYDLLVSEKLDTLLHQYFCPDTFSFASQATGNVILCAYNSILSLNLTGFSINQLSQLAVHYPVDRLHQAIFTPSSTIKAHKKTLAWEDSVRNIFAVPAKVANHLHGKNIPVELQHRPYFTHLCLRFEPLLRSSCERVGLEVASSLAFLVSKMINVGLFPTVPGTLPSFFATNLPTIRTRLSSLPEPALHLYSATWTDLWASEAVRGLNTVIASLFCNLTDLPAGLDPSTSTRGVIKREANIVGGLIGILGDEEDDKWQAVSATLLSRAWDEAKARVIVCWIAQGDDSGEALEKLISKTIDVWASPEHITHSLLSHHQYLTTLLLTAVSYLATSDPTLQSLAFSQQFIAAIGSYIAHLDRDVRRCGMLAAEVVAQRTGKALDFGTWENCTWARDVRTLLHHRDIDAEAAEHDVISLEPPPSPLPAPSTEHPKPAQTAATTRQTPVVQTPDTGYDSDDSLTGYASPASSRSPSPTPSEQADYERDPTLRVGVKKVAPPVYLSDLGTMLRGPTPADDPQSADRIAVALSCAEELIRKKRDYGLELEENAVNLVYGLAGLQDNFELENFDAQRQGAVTALVACCPQKAAPAIIDEFFKNQYSTEQRFVMLNALALGARELAALPVPKSAVSDDRLSFPSRKLPPSLHDKYVPHQGAVQKLVEGITQLAIDKEKDTAHTKVPALARERQLRITRPPRITSAASPIPMAPRNTSFADVAATSFIVPLTTRFWLFLRDEHAREERSAAYHGAGTGLILSALVLAQFTGTLAVLTHAARHAPVFLAVIAPDTLELAVTLGTRRIARAEAGEREAAVLCASLELALVVLDACVDLDGGRSLGLDHTVLLMGAGDWAGQVLGLLDGGMRVHGGGGAQDARLKRAAAGVVIKADEITSKWRQSMITL